MGSTTANSVILTVIYFAIAVVLSLPFLLETLSYHRDQEAKFRFVVVFLLIVIAWGVVF